MAAAVHRPAGFGEDEALTPEEALALFTGSAEAPGADARRIASGEPADLCLLDRSWSAARRDLASVTVRLTLVGGNIAAAAVSLASPAGRSVTGQKINAGRGATVTLGGI